ncbi:hypothetical protein K3495_g4860 [Podosphaera aphanis]|nr:hypothetical protein K3495_g4860 [Podosphaera aphanis]
MFDLGGTGTAEDLILFLIPFSAIGAKLIKLGFVENSTQLNQLSSIIQSPYALTQEYRRSRYFFVKRGFLRLGIAMNPHRRRDLLMIDLDIFALVSSLAHFYKDFAVPIPTLTTLVANSLSIWTSKNLVQLEYRKLQ